MIHDTCIQACVQTPLGIEAEDYYWTMAGRGRLLAIWELRILCTYFVLGSVQEVPHYYHRTTWSTPPETPGGTVIYIDKLLGHQFNRGIFHQLERVVTQQVPAWQMAVWYRPTTTGPERQVIYHRRGGM